VVLTLDCNGVEAWTLTPVTVPKLFVLLFQLSISLCYIPAAALAEKSGSV